ncbi:MAG TPA: YceI family protein [Gammaproteobacteria bacterium]
MAALAGTCAGIAWIGTAAAAEWTVVDDSSAVKFSAVQQGSRFNGEFEEFEATIDFDPSHPEAGSIVGVVQMASVNTRDHDRDATLGDPEWFNTSEYPEARFESQSIEKTDDGAFVAAGELTIKGKTNPAELRFTFDTSDPSAAHFLGTMKIDRFDYNVGEGWNDTSFVGQDVDVEVDLSLMK